VEYDGDRDRIDLLVSSLDRIEGLDVDLAPMHVMIRMARVYEVVEQRLKSVVSSEYVRHKKDHDLLVMLLQAEAPLTNRQLQRVLRLTPASVSQRVARLERAGLIHRARAPADTRSNFLTLTSLGRDVTVAGVQRSVNRQRSMIESALEPAEVAELVRLLRKLNLSLEDVPAPR